MTEYDKNIKKLEQRVKVMKSTLDDNENTFKMSDIKLTWYHKHVIVFVIVFVLLLCNRPTILYSINNERHKTEKYFDFSKLFICTVIMYIIIVSLYYYIKCKYIGVKLDII